MTKSKIETKFKPKSKSSLGRHAKSDSLNKNSKNYKKQNVGQGR
jgi:hypothetical protein